MLREKHMSIYRLFGTMEKELNVVDLEIVTHRPESKHGAISARNPNIFMGLQKYFTWRFFGTQFLQKKHFPKKGK